jgi:hypothetical protein
MKRADEPAATGALPAAVAIEVTAEAGPAPFVDGIATGIAIAAVVIQSFLAFELAAFRGMYRDLGGTLPAATRLVLTDGWRWGVPAAGALAITGLVFRRPRNSWAYLAVAVVMVAASVATWYLARMPVYELAGNIKAD